MSTTTTGRIQGNWGTPGRAAACLLALAATFLSGCRSTPPAKADRPLDVTVSESEGTQKVDPILAERLKLEAEYRRGMRLLCSGQPLEGMEILRGVAERAAETGVADCIDGSGKVSPAVAAASRRGGACGQCRT